jgi:hypothetical protein
MQEQRAAMTLSISRASGTPELLRAACAASIVAVLAACGGGSRDPAAVSPSAVPPSAAPPVGAASTAPPKVVALSAVSRAADLVLVNFAGDCHGVRARLFDAAQKRFFAFDEPAPCTDGAYAAPADLYSGLLSRALGGRLPVVELLQTEAGQRLSVSDRVGDCRVVHLEVRDEFVGNTLDYIAADPCNKLDMSSDPELPARMVSHYVANGVEPILAASPYSAALTRCDRSVGPSTLASTLAELRRQPTGAPGSRWQVVCLQPGAYAGPFRLEDADHVMLVAAPGTATLQTDLPITSELVGAPLEVRRSSNVVLQGISFANAHQFAYSTSPTVNTQYAVGLYLDSVSGLHVADVRVVTGGKETAWFTGVSFAQVRNVDVTGSYFALSFQYSTVLGKNVKVTTDHPISPRDEHSMFWLEGQRVVMRDSTFLRRTGHALASGNSVPQTDAIFLKNVDAPSPGLDAWFQEHPNYFGLHMILSGSYPASTAMYFQNMSGGGGPSRDMSLVKE